MTMSIEEAKEISEPVIKNMLDIKLSGGFVDNEISNFLHNLSVLLECEFSVYSTGSAFKVRV